MVVDDEHLRVHVAARLRLFSRLGLVTFTVVAAFVVALARLYPIHRPHDAHVILAGGLGGVALCAAVWLGTVHRRRPSLAALYRVDASYTAVIGAVLGLTAYVYTARYAAVFAALVMAVFFRAIVVPSTGARTFLVTSLAFLPLLAAGVVVALVAPHRLDMPVLPFMAAVALFGLVAIALASTGSQVIYGLRRRVSEAMQLGQYTLEGRLGSGAMGEVHRARHAMLRRPTAIKLLRPERHDARSLARFEREVQHMSRLTHPNTVAVYDYGRSPDGVLYYVMEYLDGVDLDTLVRRHGPQPAGRVIHILHQVCLALEEAHAMGLVHRDVKPANIILCRRGTTFDVAKLVDFGLVQEIAVAGDGRGIEGTPACISPEAVVAPAELGPASDLYGLGATAYFLLTGQPVFAADDALGVCMQHVRAHPVPPSQRTAEPVPAELEALVLACLAKAPAHRPAGARDLAERLLAVPERETWDATMARAWWHRVDRLGAERATAAALPTATLTIELGRHAAPDDAPGAHQEAA